VLGHVLVERHLIGPSTAPPEPLAIARLVDHDAVDPGLEGGLPPERVQGAKHPEEDLLGKVQCLVAIAQQVQRERVDHALVPGDELGAGHLLAGGTPLDERGFPAGYVRPSECACVLHQFLGDKSWSHGQCKTLRTRVGPKVPPGAGFATIHREMRRTLLALALVAAAGVVGALAYSSFTTEREFVRLVAAGDEAAAAGRAFEALEAYSGALALVPDAMVPYLKRGRVYQEQGQAEAALRDLHRAAELDPSATRPLEWLGDISLELDRHDRAADYFRRVIALDDRNPRVLYKRAVAHYRAGSPTEAAAAVEAALALDSTLNDARFLLGLCQRDLGQLPTARRTLETVVKEAPATAGAREALAEVYAALGERQRAIDQLEALSTLDPDRPERLVALGLAQASAGRDNQAVLVLGRAVERFPDAPLAYEALGHVWLEMAERRGDRIALMKAIEALTQAANYSSSSSGALTDLGRAWVMAGDLAAAERALRQAVERLPVAPEAFRRLAQVSQRQGHPLEARDALLQYAALVGDRDPIAAVATDIAALSIKVGEPLMAVRWLERALNAGEPSPRRLALLADAALQSGDLSRAQEAVEAGLRLAPADPALLALKRRLASELSRR